MDEAEPIPKKRKETVDLNLDSSKTDPILSNFLEWMNKERFEISSKIEISKTGACARYGLIALDDIRKDEILFRVPRTSLLWESNCSISSELSAFNFPTGGSGWVKLILCLMFEYTNASSRWKPYMRFVPSVSCMDQPMFWSPEQRELLKGTGLQEAVNKDISSIKAEYADIALPFIRQHTTLGFKEDIHTLDLYKHMVAFVMAYSFTERSEDDDDDHVSPPVMAPFADVLNHISHNNAHFEFETDWLSMVAIKPISKGEEIHNTYGQLSNGQLLQMYGFLEKPSDNIYDTVDIKLSIFFAAAKSDKKCWEIIDQKMQWLDETRSMDRSYAITVGKDGILNVYEFKLLLKVLAFTEEKFQWYVTDSDEWDTDSSTDTSEEDTDCEFDVFSFRKLKQKLSRAQKALIKEVTRIRLQEFGSGEDHNADNLEKSSVNTDRVQEWRVSRSKSLVEGQHRLLRTLADVVAA